MDAESPMIAFRAREEVLHTPSKLTFMFQPAGHRIRRVLRLLDDIASNDNWMASEDIERLCTARELLARALGCTYNERTNRYE